MKAEGTRESNGYRGEQVDAVILLCHLLTKADGSRYQLYSIADVQMAHMLNSRCTLQHIADPTPP